MGHYIDKSALVAEIEKRQKEEVLYDEDGSFASWADQNHYSTLESIKDFIDTLEVKNIEDLQSLEKEIAKGKNILILKKILSRFFESANANDEEFSKAIEDIENGLI